MPDELGWPIATRRLTRFALWCDDRLPGVMSVVFAVVLPSYWIVALSRNVFESLTITVMFTSLAFMAFGTAFLLLIFHRRRQGVADAAYIIAACACASASQTPYVKTWLAQGRFREKPLTRRDVIIALRGGRSDARTADNKSRHDAIRAGQGALIVKLQTR